MGVHDELLFFDVKRSIQRSGRDIIKFGSQPHPFPSHRTGHVFSHRAWPSQKKEVSCEDEENQGRQDDDDVRRQRVAAFKRILFGHATNGSLAIVPR